MPAAPRPNCSADGLDACGPAPAPPAWATRLRRASSCVTVFSSFSSHAPSRSHSREHCVPCAQFDRADRRAASACSLPQRVPLACAIAPRCIATHFRLHRSVSGFLPAAVSFIVVLPSQAFQVPPAMLVQRRREATHLIPTDVADL